MNGRHRVAWRPRGAGPAWAVVDYRTGSTVDRHELREGAERLAEQHNARTLAAAIADEARRLDRAR